ncbi:MAG: MotA/TolQ/ExbB proton channel family protein [Phycisphaerae bacterium]|nr:MotA/TolQ/ExbB proton channel family protein [Phycisphaerae bacterium]
MQSFGSIFFITHVTDAAGETRVEWIGSSLIWFLILLSVVNVALVVFLALRNRRVDILPEAFADRVHELAAGGNRDEAMQLVAAEASDYSRMLASGLSVRGQGLASMVRTVEQASEELTVARFRAIESLNILGQVSPMIGLFGTVYGMIMAFQSIVATGGSADPVVLAGGIGTALVTTFWGLLIAIPALAAYAGIRNKVDALATEATRRAEETLSHFAPEPATA